MLSAFLIGVGLLALQGCQKNTQPPLSEITPTNKEIKLLEKRKNKMEKMYEKMSGKSFAMPQVVGEEEKEDNE